MANPKPVPFSTGLLVKNGSNLAKGTGVLVRRYRSSGEEAEGRRDAD